MKTCYLAGPYYNDIARQKLKNIMIAGKGAEYLSNQGYIVFSPHFNFEFISDWETTPEGREKILEMCIEFVKICDVFALLPGWRQSVGCMEEYKIATFLEKEIIYLTNQDLGLQ